MVTRRYDPHVKNSSTFVEENGKEDSGLDRENTSMPDGLVGRQRSESSHNISAVAKYIHWELLGQFLMERSEKWYEHKPVGVMERNGVKVMWDFMVV